MFKIKYMFFYMIILANVCFAENNVSFSGYDKTAQLPDISFVGNMTYKSNDDASDTSKDAISVEETELAIQGYLYPKVRTDIFFALHKHDNKTEAELCEGMITFQKLVGALSGKVGKIHVDIGRVNKTHQHVRPYADQPLVITEFLGHHGMVGEGGTLDYLLPFNKLFCNFSVGAWNMPAHEHEDDSEPEITQVVDKNGNTVDVAIYKAPECNEFGFADKVYTSKLYFSYPTSDDSELSLGVSGATGRGLHFAEHKDNYSLLAYDASYKKYFERNKAFILEGEYFNLFREVPIADLNRYGFYVFSSFTFNKYFDFGVRYDYTESPWPTANGFYYNNKNQYACIATYKFSEQYSLRAQYNRRDEFGKIINEGIVQMIFGLGPHTHPVQ